MLAGVRAAMPSRVAITDEHMDSSGPENGLIDSRYRVEKRLGQGGMGSAYLASDERFLGRPVVVNPPPSGAPG